MLLPGQLLLPFCLRLPPSARRCNVMTAVPEHLVSTNANDYLLAAQTEVISTENKFNDSTFTTICCDRSASRGIAPSLPFMRRPLQNICCARQYVGRT